jgi:hypothetical protein
MLPRHLAHEAQHVAPLVMESYSDTSQSRDQKNKKAGYHVYRMQFGGFIADDIDFCDIYMYQSSKKAYCVFMGTDSWNQHFANAGAALVGAVTTPITLITGTFGKKGREYGNVWGEAFMTRAQNFYDRVIPYLTERGYTTLNQYSWIFAGHSRGGTLANYSAKVFRYHGTNVKAIITFAGAAVDSYFEDIDDTTVRIYRPNDWVAATYCPGFKFHGGYPIVLPERSEPHGLRLTIEDFLNSL